MPLSSFPYASHTQFNAKINNLLHFTFLICYFLKESKRHILWLSGTKEAVSNNHARYYIQGLAYLRLYQETT